MHRGIHLSKCGALTMTIEWNLWSCIMRSFPGALHLCLFGLWKVNHVTCWLVSCQLTMLGPFREAVEVKLEHELKGLLHTGRWLYCPQPIRIWLCRAHGVVLASLHIFLQFLLFLRLWVCCLHILFFSSSSLDKAMLFFYNLWWLCLNQSCWTSFCVKAGLK